MQYSRLLCALATWDFHLFRVSGPAILYFFVTLIEVYSMMNALILGASIIATGIFCTPIDKMARMARLFDGQMCKVAVDVYISFYFS